MSLFLLLVFIRISLYALMQPVNMILLAALTTFFLLLRYTSAAPPAGFPGDETPYRVTPTGTVSPDNLMGTYLWLYKDCNKNFGGGAKDKIDQAFEDAYQISK
jgi:hypothetical protein